MFLRAQVRFHQATQKLAIGARTGVVLIYDIKVRAAVVLLSAVWILQNVKKVFIDRCALDILCMLCRRGSAGTFFEKLEAVLNQLPSRSWGFERLFLPAGNKALQC